MLTCYKAYVTKVSKDRFFFLYNVIYYIKMVI